ncbi:MAG: epimerase [Flavobacteriaceae bacterium]|nr:epimerase [Flavobacteriaceae bacterium]|tara:strand:+ start:14666 stop:15337 length:672 start_codon:yes stop_codon:yes gene_type:complete
MDVLITGSTGMVGKSVLQECINDKRVKNIYLVNRMPVNLKSSKISEFIITDFLKVSEIKKNIKNCDACFHCMGITSFGHSYEYYYKVTFEMTKAITDLVYSINSNSMMTYVSGEGTINSENSKISWANVKGKTENYILSKGFKDAYMIRLGLLIPENGIKPKTKLYCVFYSLMKPFYPLMILIPSITTSSKLGLAMINSLYYPSTNKFLDNKRINKLSKMHLA